MLFLAKAANAQVALRRERVRLEDEVEKVLEFFEPLAWERGTKLVRHGSGEVDADRSMIRRVIANLVSNAVRYAKPGSTIEARIAARAGMLEISVANAGEALSQEQCRRVFDRFYRGPDRGSEPSEGAGLGLAIVKSIVELHGGSVAATSEAGRNVFSVKLLTEAAEPERSSPHLLQKRNAAVSVASPPAH